MRSRAHLLVYMNDATVNADIKRPAGRKTACPEYAVRARRFTRRVAQNRIRQTERGSKLSVRGRRVDACAETLDIRTCERRRLRCERPAFRSASAGKRFREPRDNDGFASEIFGETIRHSIRRLQREFRCSVAGTEHHSARGG